MAAYPLTFAEQLAEREMRVKEIHAIVAVIQCRSGSMSAPTVVSSPKASELIEKVVALVEAIR